MATSPEYPDLQWIPPRSYTKGRKAGQPTKITVHYTAGREGYDTAEAGALYDQRRTDGTSAHYYIDANSVVQCVRTTDRSHTALYHGNNEGLHYELCGTVQSRLQWLDPVSRATIRNAARQMARDMKKYGIPLVRLVGRQVRDSARKGICGHADWTVGWPEDGGTHMDPGTHFPYDVLFDDIRQFLYPPAPKPPAPEEDDDMKATDTMQLTFVDPADGQTKTYPVKYEGYLSLRYQQEQQALALLRGDRDAEAAEAAKTQALLAELVANTEPPA
jgi:hypothetical protein